MNATKKRYTARVNKITRANEESIAIADRSAIASKQAHEVYRESCQEVFHKIRVRNYLQRDRDALYETRNIEQVTRDYSRAFKRKGAIDGL